MSHSRQVAAPGGRRRMALAKQLGLLLVLPVALALGVYGLVSQEGRRRVLMAEASAELRNHATLVEAAVGGAVERGQLDVLKQRLERMARAERILGIAVFDGAGRPVLITDHLEGATSQLVRLARRASESGDDFEELCSLDSGPTLVRTVTFESRSGAPIVAIVARDLAYLVTLGSSLNRGLALTGIALLAVLVVLVLVVSRATVGRPATAIVHGAERIAAGDLETRVPEEGAEELARLGRAFNAMTDSLRDAKRRAEQEESGRVAAERKLQHARALAAVGQVAASIAHEIGSPLGVILGRARRLADQAGCPEAQKRELETIAAQSERISRVVTRLLTVARPPQSAGRSADVGRVLGEVLQFLGPECRQRRIETRVEGLDAPISVAMAPDLFFQVLFNLCLNAIEAQPSGGRLVVSVPSTDPVGAKRVTVDVVDAGPGVADALAGRIFEPFFTTKADRAGSGLGLDIVSGLLREVGGTIELVAGAGAGAHFRLTLPAVESTAATRSLERGREP